MGKVFMDGGSGLNLLFASTLRTMGIKPETLAESETGFHGIVPTMTVYTLGKISLNVVFGKPDNFCNERLEFEVVDWESQYHAILGRPAFAKFMAVPHYTYLKMKMPGNTGGPMTIHGSFLRSDNCDREFNRISSKFNQLSFTEEHRALAARVDHTKTVDDGRKKAPNEFNAKEQTSGVQVHPTDPMKKVNMANDLTKA